jgi:O-antigen/teichoic acid export membrane protein
LVIVVLADPIIMLIGGSQAYLRAANYVRVMLIGNLASGLFSWAGYVLMANERVWVVNNIHVVRSVWLLPLMAVVILLSGAQAGSTQWSEASRR